MEALFSLDFLFVFDLFKMNSFNKTYVVFLPYASFTCQINSILLKVFISRYLYTNWIKLPNLHFSFDTLMTYVF